MEPPSRDEVDAWLQTLPSEVQGIIRERPGARIPEELNDLLWPAHEQFLVPIWMRGGMHLHLQPGVLRVLVAPEDPVLLARLRHQQQRAAIVLALVTVVPLVLLIALL